MSVTEEPFKAFAEDLALSRKMDVEVVELLKRVSALEGALADGNVAAEAAQLPPAAPATAQTAWGELAIRIVRVFLFTGIATFVALITGLGSFPDMATAKSVAWSAVVAAMSAVAKVVQAAFTAGEAPFYGHGIGKKPGQ